MHPQLLKCILGKLLLCGTLWSFYHLMVAVFPCVGPLLFVLCIRTHKLDCTVHILLVVPQKALGH